MDRNVFVILLIGILGALIGIGWIVACFIDGLRKQ
jgi:hypothetical protein